MMSKTCSRCGTNRQLDLFAPNSRRLDGKSHVCIPCVKLNKKEKNKRESAGGVKYAKYKKKIKNNFLKRKYGITLEQYEKMVSDQEGKCAICKEIKKLVVDHSHKTGTVRDLLCNGCNSVLGHFHENQEVLRNASEYISKWQGK